MRNWTWIAEEAKWKFGAIFWLTEPHPQTTTRPTKTGPEGLKTARQRMNVLVLVQRDTILWWYWLPLKHDNNRTGADWMTACLPRLLANPNCLEWHNLLLQNEDVCTPIHPQRDIKYPLRESLLAGSILMMSPSCAIVLVLHYTTTTTARQHLAWWYDANKDGTGEKSGRGQGQYRDTVETGLKVFFLCQVLLLSWRLMLSSSFPNGTRRILYGA